jgi:hypothetical protein
MLALLLSACLRPHYDIIDSDERSCHLETVGLVMNFPLQSFLPLRLPCRRSLCGKRRERTCRIHSRMPGASNTVRIPSFKETPHSEYLADASLRCSFV